MKTYLLLNEALHN